MKRTQNPNNQNQTTGSQHSQRVPGGYRLVMNAENLKRSEIPEILFNQISFKTIEPLPKIEVPPDLPLAQKIFFKEDDFQQTIGKMKQCNSKGLCMKCKKEEATNICVPCGHRIFCAKCSEKIPKNRSETCPLCNVHISAAVRVFPESKCVVCCENDCSAIFIPCGHQCCCYSCASEIWKEKNPCPICRKQLIRISMEFPIFDDDDNYNDITS